jgi:hypothetical protein
MLNLKRWLALAAALAAGGMALMGSALVAQASNTFQNGQFACTNPGTVSCGAQLTTLTSSNAASTTDSPISPWVVTRNSVDLISSSSAQPYWQAPPGGGNSIDMNGTGYPADGQIQQAFSTTADTSYLVSFEFSGNFHSSSCPSSDTQTLMVRASGSSASTYTFTKPADYSYQNMGWLTEYYAFRPATGSTSTTLVFTAGSANPSNCGPVLADVSVTTASTTSCSGSCTVNLQSSTTGTAGSINASSTGGFLLQAAFGSGETLSCDSAVTGGGRADPLLVISYSNADTNVQGSVTLTFPKQVVHEIPTNKGTPHMPVCVGANQRFPGAQAVSPSLLSPFSYQGLVYACSDATYRADIKNTREYPLAVCVSAYSRVHGAERVVVQTSSLGDPMFW